MAQVKQQMTMGFSRRTVRRFGYCRRGVAATEFALILPLLMLIFFGMLEASDAMMANRRVTNATNALVDLVAQERRIWPEDITEIFTGVTRMLEPVGGSGVALRLVSVTLDPDDDSRVIVEWSRDNLGGTPYSAGATYTGLDDNTLLQAGVSLMVAELNYQHVSGLTSYVLDAPMTFNRSASRWPRRSTRVQLCTSAKPAC